MSPTSDCLLRRPLTSHSHWDGTTRWTSATSTPVRADSWWDVLSMSLLIPRPRTEGSLHSDLEGFTEVGDNTVDRDSCTRSSYTPYTRTRIRRVS